MRSLRVYILEDEIITQEVLKQTLESLNCNVCGMQANAEKALEEINLLAPDLVFLDIRVDGDKTGIWLGNQLDIPIIYLTAFSDQKNIKEAVQTDPISYLQKPFQEKDLMIALELAKSKLNGNKELLVRDKSLTVKVKVNNILYAKKEDHYLVLHLGSEKKMIRSTVQEFLDNVTDDFLQVHRSYIINKNFVSGFSNKVVKIRDTEIPISLSYLKEVKATLL
ncbi:LytR/AlgR family response regulator transcription factor [Pseudotenacibaculum haliotis]|uniref:LytR/AlgR family response regulator transcription factor n=1 Tax=Pseudotenacibaculum haliotis TaxID=1862138 RepID=A0ABW5LQ10_9FLAO